MKTSDLFEGVNDKLVGYVDIQAITQMLPDIDNPANFENAMTKLRLGQAASLTMPEKIQLALAFISLVGLTGPQKSLFIRQIMAVQTQPNPPPQTQAPVQQGQPTQQPAQAQ
jgi:hypothetical protein